VVDDCRRGYEIAVTMELDLDRLAAAVGLPDEAAMAAARERQARLTKPAGALGRLEDLSIWLAGVQGRCPPVGPQRPRVVIFAADHGVARAGVSAYPPEVTAQMVANFVAGGAAANVLARQAGATVRVVDVGVMTTAPGVPADVTRHRVRAGSGRIDVEDALTRDEALAAIAVGAGIADAEIDAGADLLVPGDMGIGNTTPCAAVVAVLTGCAPGEVVGRGTGIDDETYVRKSEVVAAAVRRGAEHAADPVALLATIGGADIAATAGLLLTAAARRTPVVLDGIVSAAAGLVVAAVAPDATRWWVAGHRSTEPAQRAALDRLGLEPLVDLGLRLGEGTGALLALPLVAAAAATLGEMATFDEAGVSDRDDD
jgi:nicotinate-nucleotide--dimethylbenzimidazole phosphoribosyltransferase